MVHMYPLLHVVTYVTRIDYKALLTPPIAKACVVQCIECRTPYSGADSSNHGVGRYLFIEKFTEYVQVRLGYCFTPYQRLWLYNGAPLVAFYDTLGIRRTYSRLKPPASSRGNMFRLLFIFLLGFFMCYLYLVR